MKESKFPWRARRARGQSIVEFALMAPILMILLSGLFEFGFIFNHYLAVLDSARNAARFSSDSDYLSYDTLNCAQRTKHFWRQTACLAITELENEHPTITLCLPGTPPSKHCTGDWDGMDDIIVSVFSVLRKDVDPTKQKDIRRFPEHSENNPVVEGWSYAYDLAGYDQSGDSMHRTGMHSSQISSDDLKALLEDKTPNIGYILVEINTFYHQVLALPWFTQFVADPIPLHIYAVWPLVSAEPTSTYH